MHKKIRVTFRLMVKIDMISTTYYAIFQTKSIMMDSAGLQKTIFFVGSDRFLVCKTDSNYIKHIFFGPKKHSLRIIYWPNCLD